MTSPNLSQGSEQLERRCEVCETRAGGRSIGGVLLCAVCEAEFKQWREAKRQLQSGPRYADLVTNGAPATTRRRERLLEWLRQRPTGRFTARGIVETSRLYDGVTGRQERATSDLRVMKDLDLVDGDGRVGGTWWAR